MPNIRDSTIEICYFKGAQSDPIKTFHSPGLMEMKKKIIHLFLR